MNIRLSRRFTISTVAGLLIKELVSFSELRFSSRSQIEDLLLKCDLRPKAIYGGWHKQPFDAAISDDIVFLIEAV